MSKPELTEDRIKELKEKREVQAAKLKPVYIIFDGPPGAESGRFVEVETPAGKSVQAGEWEERSDGTWRLGPFLAKEPEPTDG